MTPSSSLFTPINLRGITLRNRIGVAPMCQYACLPDGMATHWHLMHLGARAAGGAGLIVAEATAVSPRGRISDADLGLWSASQAHALQPVCDFVTAQGSVPGVQLGHAGRKGNTRAPWKGRHALTPSEGGWSAVAPSALRFSDQSSAPQAMSEQDIFTTIEEFSSAAGFAQLAGFRYLELHFGHGYLAHQFLSPLTNLRTDAWGGSFENRTRFALDVARAVRANWPDEWPLAAKLSITDWLPNGWQPDEAVRLAALLAEAGVDLVVCSSGAIAPGSQPPLGAGMQIPFAERVRKEAGVRSGAVGEITQAQQAEAILRDGQADVVFLAREMLRDPNWALHAAEALGQTAHWPQPYARAVSRQRPPAAAGSR